MLEILRKVMFAGVGAFSLTKEKAEKLVEELVEKGEVGAEDAKTFVKELLEKGQQEKEAIKENVSIEVTKLKENWGLVTKKDLERIEQRLAALEAKLTEESQTKEDLSDS